MPSWWEPEPYEIGSLYKDPFENALCFENDTESNIQKKYASMTKIDKKNDYVKVTAPSCPMCNNTLCTIHMEKSFKYEEDYGSTKYPNSYYMHECRMCTTEWYEIELPECENCYHTFMYNDKFVLNMNKCCASQKIKREPYYVYNHNFQSPVRKVENIRVKPPSHEPPLYDPTSEQTLLKKSIRECKTKCTIM
jgi:hypothetical protein